MKTNYRFKKAMRKLDRFISDFGEKADKAIGKVVDSDTFDKVFTGTEKAASEVTKFTKRVVSKIVE